MTINKLSLIALLFFYSVGQAEVLVDGYAGNWSNRPGEPAAFHINAAEADAATQMFIYDVLFEPRAELTLDVKPQALAIDNLEPWKNGHGYEPTIIDIPDLPSGMFFIDGPGGVRAPKIPFIVNEPDKKAEVVVVYPTNTVTAYSQSPKNGNTEFPGVSVVNLYSKNSEGTRPEAVSFQRPQNRKTFLTRSMDRMFLESDYDYKYITDAELEDFDTIADAKVVVIPGHSEYWTPSARRNFDKFVDAGGSALVLSGNAMFRSVGYDDVENPTQLTFSPRTQFTDANYPTWESTGVEFTSGGNGSDFPGGNPAVVMPYDGWKVLDATPSYLASHEIKAGDIIHNPTVEYDGVPFTSLDPVTGPVIDTEKLGFHQIDLIAFDNAAFGNKVETAGAWIDYRESRDSGRVITVGSMSWTSITGDIPLKQAITKSMLDVLLVAQADFDGDEKLTTNDIELLLSEVNFLGPPSMRFDLTGDERVDRSDVDRWVHDFADTQYGDADLDGVVGFTDFLKLAANYDQIGGWADGNFGGGPKVDFQDFLTLSSNFNVSELDLATVPEPQYPAVMLLGCIASFLRTKRNMC